jgi:hypothetical protein
MAGHSRRRERRAGTALLKTSSGLEQLESRQLLTAAPNLHFFPTQYVHNTRGTGSPVIWTNHPLGSTMRQLASTDNDGKLLTGKDRAGNEWQLAVSGPGVVIVTDAVPNDGALADDIDTIQIVGADPRLTVVRGSVVQSARVLTDGTVTFNRLFSENGVKAVILDGFTLARTVASTDTQPEVYFPRGVGYLEFHNIESVNDTSATVDPMDIVIGDAAHPLTVKPSIRIGSIFNTTFDSTVEANPAGVAVTDPTVNVLVNGQVHLIQFVSTSQANIEPAGIEYQFPQSGTTGRTAIQARSIDAVKAIGTVRNTTLSTKATPFANGLTGLQRLGTLRVGGKTDGLGVDVSRGNIGKLSLQKGLGDPAGTSVSATGWGVPVAQMGNAAFGLYGGLAVAKQVGRLSAGPADVTFQGVQDPDYAQVRIGSTKYYTRPGNAMTGAAVVTDNSIGGVSIVGNLVSSEIKAGANYASLAAGLEPVRGPSRIGPLRLRGSLVDSVVSASYRPGADRFYGPFSPKNPGVGDVAGPGVIRGNLQQGVTTLGGGETVLGNQGSGFFARLKRGYLPPPLASSRIASSVNTNL